MDCQYDDDDQNEAEYASGGVQKAEKVAQTALQAITRRAAIGGEGERGGVGCGAGCGGKGERRPYSMCRGESSSDCRIVEHV